MTLIPRKYSAADSENWTDKCGANRRLWVSCLAFGSITNVTRLSPDPRERLWKRLIILFVLWRQRSLLRSNVLWHFSGSDRLSAGTLRHTKKKKRHTKRVSFIQSGAGTYFICLTIVLFPDSPAPGREGRSVDERRQHLWSAGLRRWSLYANRINPGFDYF